MSKLTISMARGNFNSGGFLTENEILDGNVKRPREFGHFSPRKLLKISVRICSVGRASSKGKVFDRSVLKFSDIEDNIRRGIFNGCSFASFPSEELVGIFTSSLHFRAASNVR